MVLELPADDSKGGVDEMVVDVDLGESVRRPRRAPLLLLVVVDHDGGARGGDALLRSFVTEIKEHKSYLEEHSLNFIASLVFTTSG